MPAASQRFFKKTQGLGLRALGLEFWVQSGKGAFGIFPPRGEPSILFISLR